jgi:large subunit ribosomal protein L25
MTKPEVIKLEGIKREDTGKKYARKLRAEKQIPSVLYGPTVKENVHFSVSEIELEKILSMNSTKLQELTVGGQTYNTLLKSVAFHPVTDRPLHADFYVLDEKTPVTLRIPIKLVGTSKGVAEGGRIFQPLRIMQIKVLPANIPSVFTVDISKMVIGDALHVGDLDLEGIIPIDDPQRTIVIISPPKSEALLKSSAELEAEEEAEAAAELAETAEGEEGAVESTEEGDDTAAEETKE